MSVNDWLSSPSYRPNCYYVTAAEEEEDSFNKFKIKSYLCSHSKILPSKCLMSKKQKLVILSFIIYYYFLIILILFFVLKLFNKKKHFFYFITDVYLKILLNWIENRKKNF